MKAQHDKQQNQNRKTGALNDLRPRTQDPKGGAIKSKLKKTIVNQRCDLD